MPATEQDCSNVIYNVTSLLYFVKDFGLLLVTHDSLYKRLLDFRAVRLYYYINKCVRRTAMAILTTHIDTLDRQWEIRKHS